MPQATDGMYIGAYSALLQRVTALELSYEDIVDRLAGLEVKAESLLEAQERWVRRLDELEEVNDIGI